MGSRTMVFNHIEDTLRENAPVYNIIGDYKQLQREGKVNTLGTGRTTPDNLYTIKTRREVIENYKTAMKDAQKGVFKAFLGFGISGFLVLSYFSSMNLIFAVCGFLLACWSMHRLHWANAPEYGRHAWQEDTPFLTVVPGAWNLRRYYIK